MRLAVARLSLALFLCACPDGDPVGPDAAPRPDAASPVDAGAMDADSADSGDLGVSDTGTPDAGDAGDAGEPDTGEGDAGAEDAGAGPLPCPSGLVDATAWGRALASEVTFAPGGAMAVSAPVVDPGEAGDRRYVARLSTSGVTWLASVFALGATGGSDFDAVVHDPVEDAVYAVFRTRGVATEVRLFSADGTLAATFGQGGSADRALVGERGNFNFILVKYDGAGAVQWATRFGPNDPTGSRTGSIESIVTRPGLIRVTTQLSSDPREPGSVVFAPGTPSESSSLHPEEELLVTASFDRATGAYASGSARFFEGDGFGISTVVGGNGTSNAGGDFALAGWMRGGRGGAVRLGDGSTISPPRPAAVVATYTEAGALRWARTVLKAGSNITPRPTAVGVATDGSVVAGFTTRSSNDVLEGFEIESGVGGPSEVQLGEQDALLVRWSASGEVVWTYRIRQNTDTAPLSVLYDEPAGSVYVLGLAGPRTTFEVEAANPITFSEPGGWYLLKLELATGAFEAVEQLFTAPVPVLQDPLRRGAATLRIPASGDEVRVGREPGSPVIDLASPRGQGFGWIDVDLDGRFIACGRVVDAARGLLFD